MFERITFDPQILGGRACIRGMRIPVSVIVGQIAHGAPVEEILQAILIWNAKILCNLSNMPLGSLSEFEFRSRRQR